jgi:protein associated with RNAse G/E
VGSTVAITKLDHTGRTLLTYSGELVEFSADEVIVRCEWTMPQNVTVGFMTFATGDILWEHFYREEWFNIFELCTGDGQLKGWYCNLTEPVAISDCIIYWRDLALDLIISPSGQQMVMDEDEFEALQPSDELRRTARDVLATLRCWVVEGHPPFTQDGLELPERLS